MTAEARRAIAVIRECIESERFALSLHFIERMQQRGLFWPDVLAVIDEPDDMQSQGMDDYNRLKWMISGRATYAGEIEMICAIEVDESETEFITLYWDD